MRNRTAPVESDAIGTDSFMDVVANLVGILLILIMVIGVRMDNASQTLQAHAQADLTESIVAEPLDGDAATTHGTHGTYPHVADVEAAQARVAGLESGIREAELETRKLQQQARAQRFERDQVMLAVTVAEKELQRRRANLNERQQESLALELNLNASREEFQSLSERTEAAELEERNRSPEVIQHIATPLAKTVFAREEHFRLMRGRLAYVPLNALTERLRSEAPKKMWKLNDSGQTTETIGPQDGFSLRYTLRRNRIPITNGDLVAVREVVELDRFVMIPAGNLLEETIVEALRPNSAFRQRLDAWGADDTIITVWTYPDSFQEFRELKGELFQLGFLTAARPLPGDQLISGSPSGTRSAAQ